jgi:hypothetical protein
MYGVWTRALQVFGGATLIAAGFCLHEATMPRQLGGTDRLGARATPWPVCAKRDAPAIFLLAVAVLMWKTRIKSEPRE